MPTNQWLSSGGGKIKLSEARDEGTIFGKISKQKYYIRNDEEL